MLLMMRRVFAGIVVLVAVSAVAVVGCSAGVVPGTEGCVWRSVDEAQYVRANEAVLRSIPLHPRLRRAYSTTWNHGIPAQNKCLPFYENSPPYSAFVTTHVFVRPAGELPIGFDAGVLGPEWSRESVLSPDQTYRRGTARLSVTNGDESVLLRVDHRAY
jgi:hypothetical protein